MNAKWTVWIGVLALSLAAAAAVTLAQDRPAEPAWVAAGDQPGAPASDGPADLGDPEDMDGLETLFAAGMDADMQAAQGPGMRGMGPGPAAMADLHKKLNLTDEQRTKLADIHDRSARAAVPIQGDLKIAGLDLRKLVRADKPDPRAIDAQIDKIAGLRAKLQKSHMAAMLEARGVLTPAQQKILREERPGMMMGRGMRRMQGMHGSMGMGGPGMQP